MGSCSERSRWQSSIGTETATIAPISREGLSLSHVGDPIESDNVRAAVQAMLGERFKIEQCRIRLQAERRDLLGDAISQPQRPLNRCAILQGGLGIAAGVRGLEPRKPVQDGVQGRACARAPMRQIDSLQVFPAPSRREPLAIAVGR